MFRNGGFDAKERVLTLVLTNSYSEEECNRMVSEFRRKLLDNLDETVEIELDEFGRPRSESDNLQFSTKGSHQLAVATNKRNEMLRDAFGLDESYDRISSLSRIPFKKKGEIESAKVDVNPPQAIISNEELERQKLKELKKSKKLEKKALKLEKKEKRKAEKEKARKSKFGLKKYF
ncbi:serine/arginine repetitive matrix protein 2-like [Octopus sinensis]|uniref:Serine/arginine repetitive matrix protein 2-like n=1 Tax=Octopus sinensis TaxID=2607531 RepID=A0A6P7TUI6_9MOLL|nr:serine/arginine repetitive matrix protein 2-like [Octopus sinensis]